MKITNRKQFEILVAVMERNPSLAKGFCKDHVPNNAKGEWEAISSKLNANGPPVREVDGWQRVWKDLKFKVKIKLMYNNKREAKCTGGSVFKQMPLSTLEESDANVVQFDKLLNPVDAACGGQEGMHQDIEMFDNDEENLEDGINLQNIATPSSSRITSTKKRNKNEEIVALVKSQNQIGEKHHEETPIILTEIQNLNVSKQLIAV